MDGRVSLLGLAWYGGVLLLTVAVVTTVASFVAYMFAFDSFEERAKVVALLSWTVLIIMLLAGLLWYLWTSPLIS